MTHTPVYSFPCVPPTIKTFLIGLMVLLYFLMDFWRREDATDIADDVVADIVGIPGIGVGIGIGVGACIEVVDLDVELGLVLVLVLVLVFVLDFP